MIALAVVVLLVAVGASLLWERIIERAGAVQELAERNPPTRRRQG